MLANIVLALYALLPITLLTSNSMPSALFYALLAASLALLAQQRFAHAGERTRRYGWLIASYGVLFVAVAASSLYHGSWAGANSEGALRYFLGLWILLLALPHIGRLRMQSIAWGIYAAGLVATVIITREVMQTSARPEAPTIIIVSYSAIMMLLCALTVYSLKWKLTPLPRLEAGLKVVFASVMFCGVLLTQTRTGLLGLPLFLTLGVILFMGFSRPGRTVVALAALCLASVAVVVSTDHLRDRIMEGVQEIQTCQGDRSTEFTSMCIRLQMWRTAVHGGLANPWAGVGEGRKFNQYMQDVGVPQGFVAQAVVDEPFGEPHNDLLLMFFSFGFPGVLGLLLVYLTPAAYFLPRLVSKNTSSQAKAAAAMGLAVCIGFFCFGITETMFRRMNTIGFYTALVAWLMVLSEPDAAQQDAG